MKPAFIILLLIASAYIQSFAQVKQSLIVSEYRIDADHAGNYRYLISYNFIDGVLNTKDTILGAQTFRDDIHGSYVRYDLGLNFIYRNRFIIGGNSSVVDMVKKEVLSAGDQRFLEARGDTLFFHRANSHTGTGNRILNLVTGETDFIDHLNINNDKNERSSPNKAYYLSIDMSVIPRKIRLHTKDDRKGKVIVENAASGPDLLTDSYSSTIETHWLNDHSFIYAFYEKIGVDSSYLNKDDTTENQFIYQFSKLTLRKYDIVKHTDEVFYTIGKIKPNFLNGRFYKDKIGQTVYSTGVNDYFLLDTAQETLKRYPYYELGNGFSFENKYTNGAHKILYNDSVISKVPAYRNINTGKNIITVLDSSNHVQVWNTNTKEWI